MKAFRKILAILICICIGMMTLPIAGFAADAEDFTEVASLEINVEKDATTALNHKQLDFNIDASQYNNLYLKMSFYIARTDNVASIDGFFGGDGQIEISSSGKNDVAEIHWMNKSVGLVAGWNTLYLSFAGAIATDNGEVFDPSKINFFRFYQVLSSEDVTFDLKICDVAIVSKNSSLEVDSLYSDGMIFQQNKPIALSGTGDVGHTVTASVTTAGGDTVSTASGVVADNGKWQLSLPAVSGGYTEYSILFTDNGKRAMNLKNIVFGELWLAAGQSNMEFKMRNTPSAQEIIANPQDKYIKILYMPSNPATGSPSGNVPYDAQTSINGAVWSDATNAEILKECSAVAYYFAEELRAKLDVPVGILNVAQGATSIYGWLSREAIEGDSEVFAYLEETDRYLDESTWNQAAEKNYKQMTAMYNQKIAPLTVFNIAGTIWYQGENEIGDESGTYANALELLLTSYSESFDFQNSSMPLIFAHLAPHFYATSIMDKAAEMSCEFDAVWRAYPNNTAQIPIYDLPLEYDYTTVIEGSSGEAAIHPMVKEPVGKRMANAALGLVYDTYDEYTAPVYNSVTVDGNSLLVKFDHVGEGLAAKASDGSVSADDNTVSLSGFAICGADGIYLPAKATIVSSDTVKVTNESIDYPIGVTYAYTQMNTEANLVSTRDNAPLFAAAPFCTQRIDDEQFYRPVDWLSSEYTQKWHSDGTTAGYYDTWRDGTLNPGTITSVSLCNTVKTEGANSLKVDFLTSKYWAFGISPNIFSSGTTSFLTDIDRSLEKYDTLSFDIKQETGKQLKFNITLKSAANTSVYCNPKVTNLVCTATNGSYTGYDLGTTNEWQTVTIDLKDLKKNNSSEAISVALTAITNMEFTFGANIGGNKAGVIYLDNFRLGFSEDKTEVNKQSVLTSVSSADSIEAEKYTVSTRIAFKTALQSANSVLGTASASQEESDSAYSTLQAAISALRLIGDCDNDGGVNARDLISMRDLFMESDNVVCEAADINEDSLVNAVDIVRLKKQLANLK